MRIRVSLIFLSICALTGLSAASSGEPGRRYTNQTYGYSVALPPNSQTMTTPPPAPQHGVTVAVSQAGHVWIDGSYDARFLGSAHTALSELASDESVPSSIPMQATKLSSLPAARMRYKHDDKVTVRLVALRSRVGDVAILYKIGLDTDVKHSMRDEAAFNTILRSFSVLALPK
jgi:hypothetical protein